MGILYSQRIDLFRLMDEGPPVAPLPSEMFGGPPQYMPRDVDEVDTMPPCTSSLAAEAEDKVMNQVWFLYQKPIVLKTLDSLVGCVTLQVMQEFDDLKAAVDRHIRRMREFAKNLEAEEKAKIMPEIMFCYQQKIIRTDTNVCVSFLRISDRPAARKFRRPGRRCAWQKPCATSANDVDTRRTLTHKLLRRQAVSKKRPSRRNRRRQRHLRRNLMG